METISLFWFRRDLRLHDNKGLYYALNGQYPVLPIFIFDKKILNDLEAADDRRVNFIYEQLERLHKQLQELGSGLAVFYGSPVDVFKQLTKKYQLRKVFANHDYEPYARQRDNTVKMFLQEAGVPFETFKDQVIFEKSEITKADGKPYTVFTPYMRKWKRQLAHQAIEHFPSQQHSGLLLKIKKTPWVYLEDIKFKKKSYTFPPQNLQPEIVQQYDKLRDYPGAKGTSRLSVHLRFGTVSIRQMVRQAQKLNDSWLNELIWREFYMMILWQFPHVEHRSFKPEYDHIPWRNNEAEFAAWCQGRTGYPIVDAGMRELNQTGYMHNRVRMITASFLTKHLLIDWRWGETYFATRLLDYELASNNGGWQWAAGSGCDAAPYFRIFNPQLQTQKFDPHHNYIRRWVPEASGFDYPLPIVEHKAARQRALTVYKSVLKPNESN